MERKKTRREKASKISDKPDGSIKSKVKAVKKLNITCIDADFIPYYVCYNKKGNPEKTLEDCIKLTDEFIININRFTKANFYLGYLTRGKCFRYEVYPEYKSNRKSLVPPKYANEVRQYLIDNYGFTSQQGYEADDLVMSYKAQNPDYNVTIVSPDKDILKALPRAFNPRVNKFVENTKEEIDYNFWESMICGDTIDNIKGIPGKGKAFFKELDKSIDFKELYPQEVLNAYIEHYGEYEGIAQFNKNYFCLNLVDTVKLDNTKLTVVLKPTRKKRFNNDIRWAKTILDEHTTTVSW